MKKLILAILAAGAFTSAQAQWAAPGLLFGGVAGGLIAGGHHVGEGIAIGAASGLFVGSVADAAIQAHYAYGGYYGGGYYGYYGRPYSYAPFYTTCYSGAPAYYSTAPARAVQPPAPPPSAFYNSYSATPMSGANALFGR